MKILYYIIASILMLPFVSVLGGGIVIYIIKATRGEVPWLYDALALSICVGMFVSVIGGFLVLDKARGK